MRKRSWLLFLYGLPTESKSARVNLWRKLKKFGAVQRISAYILPDEPVHLERFQWLATQVKDGGGDASVVQTNRIDGLADEELVRLFQAERSEDYRALMKEVQALVSKKKGRNVYGSLEKAQRRFREIKMIDYFDAAEAHEAEALLAKARNPKHSGAQFSGVLERSAFKGKTWLTRPRPEIDRVGSAWLIKRFIDPEAKFLFSPRAQDVPAAIPYDMPDVEFTHHGDDCTFETLLKRFGLRERGLATIAEMIHDADVEDEKYGRVECIGLDLVLKGYGKSGISDEEILHRGFMCLDGLLSGLR